MDKHTEKLKAELTRAIVEAAEATICRRLHSLVSINPDRVCGNCIHLTELGMIDLRNALRKAFQAGCAYAVGSHKDFKQTHLPEDDVVSYLAEKVSPAVPRPPDVGWCCTDGISYTLDELGDDAWLTGCPYCGASDCGSNLTPAHIAERDEFYG